MIYGITLQKLETFGEVINRKHLQGNLKWPNYDLLLKVGLLCLTIREAFELEAL